MHQGQGIGGIAANRVSPAVAAALLCLVAAAGGFFLFRVVAGGWPYRPAVINDFSNFWVAARLAWLDQFGRIYDIGAYNTAMREFLPSMPAMRYAFAYPPSYLLVLYPLGGLSQPAAFVASNLAGVALLAAVLYASCPKLLVLPMAVLSPAVTLNLWFGQNGLLFGALAAVTLTMARSHPLLAGTALGMLARKPHFAAAIGLIFLLARQWSVLAIAAVAFVAVSTLSAVFFGPGLWQQYVAGLSQVAAVLDVHPSVRGSVFWMLSGSGSSPLVAAAGQAVVAVVAAAAAGRQWRGDSPMALRLATVAAALPLILPRLGTYDLVLPAVAAAALLHAGRGRPDYVILAMAFWLMPMVVQLALFLHLQILVVLSALLLVSCLQLALRFRRLPATDEPSALAPAASANE